MNSEQLTIFGATGALIVGHIIQRLDRRRIAEDVKQANAHAAADAAKSVEAAIEKQNIATLETAREVKADFDTAQADYLLKLEIIRIEGNSKMGAQKKSLWNALLRLAKSSNNPQDEAEARRAEQDYNDHMEAEALAEQRIRTFIEGQKMQQLEVARKKVEGEGRFSPPAQR